MQELLGGLPNIGFRHRMTYESWISTLDKHAPNSSNVPSITLPFQRWFKFKEAFAPNLISECFSMASGSINTCLDPFGGCGTTGLTSQFLGVKPILSEVNPFIADVAEAKLQKYERKLLLENYLEIRKFVRKSTDPVVINGLPGTFSSPGVNNRYLFIESTLRQIMKYREAINKIADPQSARLLRVLLGSVLVPLSNVIVNGKGRKYRKNWELTQKSPQDVDMLFENAFLQAISDIERYSDRATTEYTLLRGSCLERIDEFPQGDCAIFSPPYPNSFDYTDIYNIELWVLGYLQSATDNTSLRNSTLRSHVQCKFAERDQVVTSQLLEKTINKLDRAKANLWSPQIPQMVLGYFADLNLLLEKMHSRLRAGGSAFAVVGDSCYCDVNVNVAEILAEIAETCGYEVVEIKHLRQMRKSAQQGGAAVLNESLLHIRSNGQLVS
jgi:DNA modification methylase